MPTVEASGTQTAVVGTEHTLSAFTSNRNLQLWVDLSNMVAGDSVHVRLKRKVLSSGSIRTFDSFQLSGAPATDGQLAASVPFSAPHGATVTLEQEAGTSRDFAWSLESL
jgi:hypothetical protein